jgi:kynurenine 3-monooxygenase
MPDKAAKTIADIGLIGGGPVGALLSCLLARRDFEVDVFERRPDLRTLNGSSGRSINLALSTRGLTALKYAGLEKEVLELAIPMRGRMIHPLGQDVCFQPYGKDDSEYINSISRSSLNKLLLNHAEKTGKVRFHFQNKVTGINIENNAITVSDELKKKSFELMSDVVIGCDGTSSAIRNQLALLGQLNSRESVLDYGYKELTIVEGKGGTFQIEKHALHIWPRGTFMLIALPNLGGSFTCTLFLPFEGDISFENLKTPEAVSKFFNQYFPDIPDLIPDLQTSFFENPTGQMSTIKCFPWNVSGRLLLMGDAAHAIVPFFGQGMNCGFEDVMVLEQCMTDHTRRGGALYVERRAQVPNPDYRRQIEGASGWETVFQDFVQRRKVNADAIADLAVENFEEMRDKVTNPQFILEKDVERLLQTKFPGRFVSRYRLVTFTNEPYALAQAAGRLTDEILHELCLNIRHAQEVDLELAEKLINTKLAPILGSHSLLKT